MTSTRVHRIDRPLEMIDPGELRATGYGALVLDGAATFNSDGELEARLIHLLREAVSHALRVEWTAATSPSTDPVWLCHLQPPSASAPAAADACRVWHDRFGYGRCYYRKGPGFVTVRDTRDQAEAARFLLDEPPVVAAFAALEQSALHLPSAQASTVELFELLAGERLTARCGDWGVLLPARMRMWPVPFNAV